MEIERRVGAAGRIELWGYEWDIAEKPAKKTAHKFLGYEKPVKEQVPVMREAICWSYGRTLGNIAVSSQDLLGRFPGKEGDDAQLDCDIVDAGKMRATEPLAGGAALTSATGVRMVTSPAPRRAARCSVRITLSRCRTSSTPSTSTSRTSRRWGSGARCLRP